MPKPEEEIVYEKAWRSVHADVEALTILRFGDSTQTTLLVTCADGTYFQLDLLPAVSQTGVRVESKYLDHRSFPIKLEEINNS